MANPIGDITVYTTITAKESVRQISGQKGSNWSDIKTASTECPDMNFQFNTESITYQDDGGSDDGYLNRAPYYVNVTTTSTAAVAGLSDVEFICFKHTGYTFNTFTDATCDTSDTSGSGSTFDDNPTIIRMDNTNLVRVGQVVSGTGITGTANVSQIDSATLFRIDENAASDQTNTTLTFTDHANLPSLSNRTDHLEIRALANDGFVIAVLPPGGGIALPVQSPSSGWTVAGDEVDSEDYFFQSVNPISLEAGSLTIAMEFICVTAS